MTISNAEVLIGRVFEGYISIFGLKRRQRQLRFIEGFLHYRHQGTWLKAKWYHIAQDMSERIVIKRRF